MKTIFIDEVCFRVIGACDVFDSDVHDKHEVRIALLYNGGEDEWHAMANSLALLIRQGNIIISSSIYRIGNGSGKLFARTSELVECMSSFNEFIVLLRRLSKGNRETLTMINNLTPESFKRPFGTHTQDPEPITWVPSILWPFLRAPNIDIERSYNSYIQRAGVVNYPLDMLIIEKYLLEDKYTIRLLRNGEVVKYPSGDIPIVEILDTGHGYEYIRSIQV